jgi:hypothetical protein
MYGESEAASFRIQRVVPAIRCPFVHAPRQRIVLAVSQGQNHGSPNKQLL